MVDRHSLFSLLTSYLYRPGRLWNAFKTYLSYFLTRALRRPVVLGGPITAMIEPTTACNLGCPHCPSGLNQFSRPTGRIKSEAFKNIIDNIASEVGYLTLYFQGEPYLNPQFTDLVAYANSKRIFTATSSNAHFLNPENARKTVASGLKRMIISIDGTTQETYGKYRLEGKLETVLAGTRNIINAKKEAGSAFPRIVWQFIVFNHNEHELEAIQQLAREYEVDHLAIKTAQIYDFDNADNWLPSDPAYSRYEKLGNEVKIKNKLLNHCWRLWSSVVFTWDGRVVPCCFDKDATHNLGNINSEKFSTLWKNERYRAFRKQLTAGRANIDICTNCSEGTKVWM